MTLNIKNILITKAEANLHGIGQEPKQKYGGKKKQVTIDPSEPTCKTIHFFFCYQMSCLFGHISFTFFAPFFTSQGGHFLRRSFAK